MPVTRVGVHPHSIQGWESGSHCPSADSLKALIAAFAAAGAFSPGEEAADVAGIWATALRTGARLRSPFDPVWFASLPTPGPSARREAGLAARRQDLTEAPQIVSFFGRSGELRTLQYWLLSDRCHIVALLGIGGVGKTTLAARVVREMASEFDAVYWRSLRCSSGWRARSAFWNLSEAYHPAGKQR